MHGLRKITTILDAIVACFHKHIDELIHAHPPRETEPDGIVVWLLFKTHSGAKESRTIVAGVFSLRITHERWIGRRCDGAKCVPQSQGFGRRRRCELVWAQEQFQSGVEDGHQSVDNRWN